MGLLVVFTIVVVAFGVAIVLYPNPPLTENAVRWKGRGQYFKFSGHRVFYIDEKGSDSSKETVLIFHGFPSSSYDWIKVLGNLQNTFGRIIIYDMLGFGFSDKPYDHSYSIFEQADIGQALLNHLGVSSVHLLAHDYGDTVALETVARYNKKETKTKMLSLCLSNGGIFPETNHPIFMQRMLLRPVIGDILSRLSFFPIQKHTFSKVFGAQTQPTEDEFWDFFVISRYNEGNLVIPSLLQYINERSVHKDRWVGALKSTKLPVHMIYGPSDPVNPKEFANFYRSNVPNPSITVLDNHISHYPQWEAPEEFMQSYYQFLHSLK